MQPGFYYRWKRSQEGRGGEERVSACGREGWRRHRRSHGHSGVQTSGFGVRRPLRYMAHRLDLDDEQIDVLAGILNVLKTERAQARLDEQRSIAGIADAVEGERLRQGASGRSAERTRRSCGASQRGSPHDLGEDPRNAGCGAAQALGVPAAFRSAHDLTQRPR